MQKNYCLPKKNKQLAGPLAFFLVVRTLIPAYTRIFLLAYCFDIDKTTHYFSINTKINCNN